MNFYIHQNISIHTLKIEGLTNSSVCQIGSAGIIKPVSNLFNTGGFTGPGPLPIPQPGTLAEVPFVPLIEPSR